MKKSTRVNTTTPKMRPRGTGALVGVRVQADLAKRLDDWRRKQDDLPGRPEAIRRLVEKGLSVAQSKLPISEKSAAEASAMAGATLDRLSDKSATAEERATRKQRLLKGPKGFR